MICHLTTQTRFTFRYGFIFWKLSHFRSIAGHLAVSETFLFSRKILCRKCKFTQIDRWMAMAFKHTLSDPVSLSKVNNNEKAKYSALVIIKELLPTLVVNSYYVNNFIRGVERTSIMDLLRIYRLFGRKNNNFILLSVSSSAYTMRYDLKSKSGELGYQHKCYKSFRRNSHLGLKGESMTVNIFVSMSSSSGRPKSPLLSVSSIFPIHLYVILVNLSSQLFWCHNWWNPVQEIAFNQSDPTSENKIRTTRYHLNTRKGYRGVLLAAKH